MVPAVWSRYDAPTTTRYGDPMPNVRLLAALTLVIAGPLHAQAPARIIAHLEEWRVVLNPARIPAGPVVILVHNGGVVPHAAEIEGHGIERRVSELQPNQYDSLVLTLRAGTYEVYCPVGGDSHKRLGMLAHLQVGGPAGTTSRAGDGDHLRQPAPRPVVAVGGGPVIQVRPGPFPFADSAAALIAARPADQQSDLGHKVELGPYSNRVATVSGSARFAAWDHGAQGDSVDGTASFTTQDGARWRLLVDRVQTRDIPFNPRFGGVIMGLYYHGASGVHTPLVPTIRSSVALWAFGHLYCNDVLVTDTAMVHVMLLSRTRRPGDWALACWDCSRNPIEELQLQVTPAPGQPPFDAPGGVLFVNWERSSAQAR